MSHWGGVFRAGGLLALRKKLLGGCDPTTVLRSAVIVGTASRHSARSEEAPSNYHIGRGPLSPRTTTNQRSFKLHRIKDPFHHVNDSTERLYCGCKTAMPAAGLSTP
jgi:hypothetical protein